MLPARSCGIATAIRHLDAGYREVSRRLLRKFNMEAFRGTYLSTKENRLDIGDELLGLIREAINAGFGQIEDEDDEVLPALITTSSIIALPGQNLGEIFPVIQKLLESSSLKQGALVYNG